MPNASAHAKNAPKGTSSLYRAVWRWHFYAGLYVIPFLIMLAITGTLIMWSSVLYGRDGEGTAVVPQEQTLPVSVQADAALATVTDGTVKQYIAPKADNLAAIFRVDEGSDALQSTAVLPQPGGRTAAARAKSQGLVRQEQ